MQCIPVPYFTNLPLGTSIGSKARTIPTATSVPFGFLPGVAQMPCCLAQPYKTVAAATNSQDYEGLGLSVCNKGEGVTLRAKVPPLVALGAGAKVRIGGRCLRVIGSLGEGSFGTVWAAEDDGNKKFAIKEILCRSEMELVRAKSEGQILELLDHTCAAAERVPALVESEVDMAGPGFWRVRLVMTQVPGAPLEQFLEQRRTGDARQLLAEACRYAGELLVQLVPALEHFSDRVYHRDVTPRNILVDVRGGQPCFGLVDFGLAVDAQQWRSEEGNSDLGGDGRYWPASAWFAFGHGMHELSRYPALCHEYQNCLDDHSLGISALRCLMELSPPLSECKGMTSSLHCTSLGDVVLPKLRALRSAWGRYWSDAWRFWQPVYDAFRGNGDFKALKTAYVAAGVHHVISADLCALRNALCEARQACEHAPPENGFAGMSTLFDALLLLIRPGQEQDAAHRHTVPFEPLSNENWNSSSQNKVPEVLRWSSLSTDTPGSQSPANSTSKGSSASPASLLRSVVLADETIAPPPSPESSCTGPFGPSRWK